MAQILAFASDDAVNRAWDAYAYRARLLQHDTTLLADRSFNEELARAHERWRRLFLAQENGG